MKMKAGALAGLAMLSALAAPMRADAAVTVFSDFGAWMTAVGNVSGSFLTETFNLNAISVPGLSVASDNGGVSSQRFDDQVIPGVATTTWSYAGNLLAFGGFWDLSPNGPGTGLQLTLISGGNVETLVPGEIPNTNSGGFFGILSDDPFSQVRITNGTQALGVETYRLDTLSIAVAAVPEPATWAMMLIGLAGLGYAARRRRAEGGV